ncbi:hypothetical protein ACFYVL_44095 [Streptomyces sp. NPDC004111]|uniref:hypothetical protein n=1 Tax=Streptomyces sp. NPDC004111 TaxID=3364690 RepID=UPI0036D0C561
MKSWFVTAAALMALLPAAPALAAHPTGHTTPAAASAATARHTAPQHATPQDDTSWGCHTPLCKPLD